jgi:hypothetical protein
MFEILGVAGITISMLAYAPQVTHLGREHCSADISRRAWASGSSPASWSVRPQSIAATSCPVQHCGLRCRHLDPGPEVPRHGLPCAPSQPGPRTHRDWWFLATMVAKTSCCSGDASSQATLPKRPRTCLPRSAQTRALRPTQ